MSTKRPLMNSDGKPTPKKVKRLCVFRKEYSVEWPCLRAVKSNDKVAFCATCNSEFSISHGGRKDCERHILCDKHSNNASAVGKPISNYFPPRGSGIEQAVTRAEILFTGFLVEHNIPLAASDHAGKLFKAMFVQPGVVATDIINKYSSARTKTTAIVKEMAASESSSLIDCMRNGPFSIATDASNDKNEKLFPIVVRCFKDNEIKTELLSVLELDGKSTGENISQLILGDLREKGIDFKNCMAFTTDNANVMIGQKTGMYGKLLEKNVELYSTGCVCHRFHLAAEWANKKLPVSVGDFFIDIYYYMDKSANRQKTFKAFQEECKTPLRQVPKHCPTRWLSLGATCRWVTEQWEPLKKFFEAECEADKEEAKSVGATSKTSCRKENVVKNLNSRTMKLCVLFLSYVLPVFDVANQQFQQEAPLIHRQCRLMRKLIKDLLTVFVKPSAVRGKLVEEVDYDSKYNILDAGDVMVGSDVREYLTKVSADKKKSFLKDVVSFLTTACRYLLKNLPFNDTLLKNAEVADIDRREDSKFSSLRFFLDKYPVLLSGTSTDTVEKEFRDYQVCDLPKKTEFTLMPMDQQW